MSLPYHRAVAGEKALMQLQGTLAAFGCQQFGTAIDAERGVTMITFKHRGRVVRLEASWKGYAAALMKGKSMTGRATEDALRQAQISVCSVLRDWVKGQVTAIECGVISFEAAFMPHMLLPSGERVLDRMKLALENKTGAEAPVVDPAEL